MTASPAPRRAVGIDIGSNTFSVVALEERGSAFAVTDDASTAVRLSEGLVPGGRLRPAAVARGLENLAGMARRFGVAEVPTRAVATQVLRMAAHPEEFTDAAAAILGVGIEVIDGLEEARLVCRGATLGLAADGPWIVLDIGGQSTELCWRDEGGGLVPLSVPMGVVGLTERFFSSDPPTPGQIVALEAHVAEVVRSAVPTGLPGEALGVAGTCTYLGALDVCPGGFRRDEIHGTVVSRGRLRHWLGVMLSIPAEERTGRYGIGHARADVFPTGLVLLDAVLARLGRDRLTISVNGLRVGAALSALAR
jgi:exopolyphosphatase / guanosine-5'-triphosphate,3'-diphosphate pyrophosphatase